MLYDYLVNNYEKGEPIFLMDIVIKGMTEENIRYHLKKMTDEGIIDRFDSGIYYIPRINIFGEKSTISAEQFNREGSTRQSYEEILTVLRAMKKEVPVFMGEETKISEKKQGEEVSPAADFLIEEAMREDEKPLFVLCIGAITNVASAMMKKKEIAKHMTIVWIGGQGHAYSTPEVREFNAGNDVEAINYVLNSGVNFWQIPNDVYGKMRISLAEIERRIAPCGEIGRHLFENMETYNHSEHAGWTAGESWTLGDSPAVGVVLDPDCGFYHETEAPIILDDTTNKFEKGRPKIRVYTSVDSRFILEDFIAKLEVLYGKGFDTK